MLGVMGPGVMGLLVGWNGTMVWLGSIGGGWFVVVVWWFEIGFGCLGGFFLGFLRGWFWWGLVEMLMVIFWLRRNMIVRLWGWWWSPSRAF